MHHNGGFVKVGEFRRYLMIITNPAEVGLA